MFDELRSQRELPAPNCDGLLFQTKDTPTQWMDLYEIRADGTLWHEEYETEDRSDPEAEGLMRLVGSMTRVHKRWVPCAYTGEICFYTGRDGGWLEFSSYFLNGELQQIHLLTDTRAPLSDCGSNER